jgi:DNA-binding GntR family transcriptional regulator
MRAMATPSSSRARSLPAPPPRFGRQSSGHEVEEYIRLLIFDGHLRPGERVPQDAVAGVLALSRIPVREGLIALERDGWVTIELNRGAFVAALDEDAVRDSYELYGEIYGFALRKAVERGGDGLVPALVELEGGMRSIDDPVAFRDITLRFHNLVVEASRSPRVRVVLRSARGLVSGNFFEEIPGAVEVERKGMAAIIGALVQGDVDGAADEYRTMLTRQGDLVAAVFAERGLFTTDV